MVTASKQIKISEKTKKNLDRLKQYPRETYEDVISRLIKNAKNSNQMV